ncbi:transporter substrate-binding domain-containing protein [Geobacter sp. FeAm09]|uniref:transporter substrate-binding domain-containing protein n=1 Tax=Geobacter sp. FeAm09 TaxID=2597769 RepID=UPI0011EED3B2|nr:transporter substrate-binding domain-containing protein [Geobacter sp. FeAm09]QEM70041.1 transporter substrate-binding domain-containing protein [Geobacter sp. FeAm09]
MMRHSRGHERRNRPVPVLLRLWVFCAVAGLILAICFPCAAGADAGKRKSSVIIVGGGWDLPPYEFIDRDGKPAGYNVELTKAVAEVMGLKVEFRLGNWPEMRDKLQTGEIDLLQGMFYTDERARIFDFSNPHNNVNHAIFARRGMPTLQSLEGLRGKEVIVARGSLMHDFLARQGIAGKLILTDTPADALRLLASGKHDYAGVGLLGGIYLARELKLTNIVPVVRSVVSYRYCFAVKKGNSELLADFNEGLAILKQTGQYQKIYEKWLGVQESPRITWKEIAKYVVIAVIPLHLILLGTIFWSRSLRKQVAQRTESLTKALHELQINQKQLVQADKLAALGTLVSGVAHEINNPNGLILLSIPTLMKAHRDTAHILEEYYRDHGDFTVAGLPYIRMKAEIPRILEEMQDSGQRIKRIVSDLKDFARRDDSAGQELLDFNTAVQTAVRLAEPTFRKATDSFTVDYGAGLPRVRGNAQRIEQVIINLILNACQALPDASRSIQLSTSYHQPSGAVILRLRDEGVGISPEHMSQLTDPFFTTKRESGGTGLGLSVSAKIVRDHDGTLAFDSEPGEGTTVTLSFPIAKEEQTA